MRPLTAPLFTLALAAGTVFCLPAVRAQQALPPAPLPAVPPALPIAAPLAIPAPPGAKLRFEMDARSEDLLGLVKSLLKGIGEPTPGGPAGAGTASPAAASVNPIEDALRNGNLADILKDVNHVHFMLWEVPAPSAPAPAALPAKPGKAAAVALTTLPPVPDVPSLDTNAYYEEAFDHEGAHRILFTDIEPARLLMVGFPDKHGFAFAVSGGGYIAVSRSDGYPNMEALSAFVSRLTSAALKTKTGRQMMDSVTGGKDTDTPADKK